MAVLERLLDPPSYGFVRGGSFYKPSQRELFDEFFSRLNCFASKKNWLPCLNWFTSLCFIVPLGIFFTRYFSWTGVALGLLYSMVVLGSHGTFWLHRYCTHRAFEFSSHWVRFLCRNAVIKVIPEETYVISHHVHHLKSEAAGDPYNVHGGWLYCFLADVNHQALNKNLTKKDYGVVLRFLERSGVYLNSHEQYLTWGSACHPVWTIAHFVLNWTFWYGVFYWLGGHALATALFGFTGVWAMGIRTFNYDGHGRGVDRRKVGIDFNRRDMSVNQLWPGYVAGEWHNNHHLYAQSARSGFLPYQLDIPWLCISALRYAGYVTCVKDNKEHFMRAHYKPYIALHNPGAS